MRFSKAPPAPSPSKEQRELVQSATAFAAYLTRKWPQVSFADTSTAADYKKSSGSTSAHPGQTGETKPILNYVLAGSLASMLLSRAEQITELVEKDLPHVTEGRTIPVPQATRDSFASFARMIGDLDYVPMEHYGVEPAHLRKGGSGPSFDAIPKAGLRVLQRGESQIKVMCDPLYSYGPVGAVKIRVDGRDYVVVRPDMMLAYKVLHLLQRYALKPEKFNADFSKLLRATRAMYDEVQIEQAIRGVVSEVEAKDRRWHTSRYKDAQYRPPYRERYPPRVNTLLANPQVSPEIRQALLILAADKLVFPPPLIV